MRIAVRLVQTCAAAAVLTFWVLALRPQTLGGPAAYLVVRGDSMLPTYETGDLLVLRRVEGYAVGDVVAYRVPAGELGEGHVVVHRIVGGDPASGWVMEGDNNPAPDPWMPRDAEVVGTPWLAISGVGRVVAWLHQPVILAGLAASLVVALVVSRPSSRQPRPAGGVSPSPERAAAAAR